MARQYGEVVPLLARRLAWWPQRPNVPRAAGKLAQWGDARRLYFAAHQVQPQSGNAHNQLAVIASYAGDEVASLLHYMCALASATPFNTAHDNLVRCAACRSRPPPPATRQPLLHRWRHGL